MQATLDAPTARLIPLALGPIAPATVLLRVPDGERMLVAAISSEGLPVGTRLADDAGLPGRCLETGRPARDDDGLTCVPIGSPESAHGVLMGSGAEPDLLAVADALAEHIELSPRTERGMQAKVEALAALLDLRDGFTADDANGVVRLATAVGEFLGMTGDELATLTVAARLHDIGKIGVPDTILHKPGPLDPGERAIMERHAVWGAEILLRTPGLELAADVVRAHHERWDGGGYPAGLVGEEIPLAARIVGACEAYRAMRSTRPYRGALSSARSLALLEQAAGTNFDPGVVTALTAAVRGRAPRAPRSGPGGGTPSPRAGERHALATAIDRLEDLPVLAVSRDRVLDLVRHEPPNVAGIVEVVESDVALTAAILRTAGRTAGAKHVTTVRSALDVLSPPALQALLARINVRDFFQDPHGWPVSPEPFRAHAVAVVRAVESLAHALERPNVDELVAAATLHDVGRLVLAQAYPGFPHRIHAGTRTPEERVRAERRALGLDHAVIGSVLLRRWAVSPKLALTVERHHADDADGDAGLLRLADMLAHCAHGQPIAPRALREAGRGIGLDADDLRGVLHDLPSAGSKKRRRVSACPLSPKQLQALRRLAEGKVYKEIAADLGLATSTVRSHLHNVYGKLGANDRVHAVLIATEQGWL
jgi:putative nucleotidyltransferase with HDIG domain